MATTKDTLELIIKSVADGTGFEVTDKGLKKISSETKKTGIELSIAAEKERLFSQRQRELAQSVINGSKTVDDAETELKQYRKELGLTEKTSKKTSLAQDALGKSLVAVQGAAIAGGIAFLRSIPELVNYGLQAERAETALIAYTGSAEEAAEATEAIQRVTKGALSEFEATQNATRLYAMGLAESAAEAANLTEIAVTLGAAMGEKAGPAFENFSLMMANMSIPRMDTYGLSASEARKRINELMESTEGLTREQAFSQVVMEMGNEKLAKLKDEGFQAISSVDRLGAAWNNAKGELAEFLADGLVPYIDALYAIQDAQDDQKDKLRRGEISWDDYTAAIDGGHKALGVLNTVLGLNPIFTGEYTEAVKDGKTHTEALEIATYGMTEMEYLVDQAMQDVTGSLEGQTDALQDNVTTTGNYILSEEEAKAALDNLNALMSGDLTENYENIRDKKQELIDKSDELKVKISEIDWSQPGAQETFDNLNENLSNTQEEIEKLEESWDRQTKQMLIGMAQQALALDGLTTEELNFLTQLAGPDGFGLIDQAYTDMMGWVGDAITILDEEGDQVNELMDDFNSLQVVLSDTSAESDNLADSINNVPNSKNVTITTTYYDHYSQDRGYGGGRAAGGDVSKDKWYMVGENGPEPFFPTEDGVILPNGSLDNVSLGRTQSAGAQLGGGSNVSVQFVYSPAVSLGNQSEIEAAGRALAPVIEGAIRRSNVNRYG